jgi:hypothetical protein
LQNNNLTSIDGSDQGALHSAHVLFTEDQAFLRLYDSAPRPPPSLPTSPVRKLSQFLNHCVCRRSSLMTGEGGGGSGRGAESHERKKAWASMNSSILSGPN